MNIQEKAFHIIYDIIGIVIRWDKHQLSDKEAMSGIVDVLASHAEDEDEYPTKKKKISSFLQKKLVAPLAISALFVVILLAMNPFINFTNTDTTLPTEDKKIGFEQLEEIPSENENIQNKTVVEEFSNITNFKEG